MDNSPQARAARAKIRGRQLAQIRGRRVKCEQCGYWMKSSEFFDAQGYPCRLCGVCRNRAIHGP